VWRVKQKLKWRNKGAFRLRAARLRRDFLVTDGEGLVAGRRRKTERLKAVKSKRLKVEKLEV
jgi:hypothetical protein